jgi:hypothetical protein
LLPKLKEYYGPIEEKNLVKREENKKLQNTEKIISTIGIPNFRIRL